MGVLFLKDETIIMITQMFIGTSQWSPRIFNLPMMEKKGDVWGAACSSQDIMDSTQASLLVVLWGPAFAPISNIAMEWKLLKFT